LSGNHHYKGLLIISNVVKVIITEVKFSLFLTKHHAMKTCLIVYHATETY